MKKSKIRKPWGYFQVLDNKKVYKVKKIFVKPARKLSLQSHKYRSENWVVIEGIAKVVLEKKIYNLKKGQSIYIPPRRKHRIENNTKKNLVIIEVQLGSYLGEDDITRYKDLYNRKTVS